MPRRREIEVKLRVRDPRRLKRQLKRLGFRISVAKALEKNSLFDFPDGRLARSQQALRIRSVQGGTTLTLKGPPSLRGRYKSREEIETEAEAEAEADGARVIRTILLRIGMREVFAYRKYRTTYSPTQEILHSRSGTLVFDETPVGDFIELEGPPKWIDQVAAKLGYSPEDYITESYRSLYLAGRGVTRKPSKPRC